MPYGVAMNAKRMVAMVGFVAVLFGAAGAVSAADPAAKVASTPAAKITPVLVPVATEPPAEESPTVDPGPNTPLPADENPDYVAPVDPAPEVLDTQDAQGLTTWRCVDDLGYVFIFGEGAADGDWMAAHCTLL